MVTTPTNLASGVLSGAMEVINSPVGVLGITIIGFSIVFLFIEIIANKNL
jgi:hypothetical protein